MTIVSARDFRANQGKYLGMALEGHDVVLRSRRGNFRLTPVEDDEEEPKRDVTAEITKTAHYKAAMDDVKNGRVTTYASLEDFYKEMGL
jgi:hypothetical protein